MKKKVTICLPPNILNAIDAIPGWSRSAFIAHIMTMYMNQMVLHYKNGAEEIIRGAQK